MQTLASFFGFPDEAEELRQTLIKIIERGKPSELAQYKTHIDAQAYSLLFDFAQQGNLKAVQFLVEKCKVDINARSKFGLTPLELAKGKEVTQFLLNEKKAELPPPDTDGVTFLQRMCQWGDVEKVEFLLKKCTKSDLDINHKDKVLDTALHGTLHGATDLEDTLAIVRLLLKNGASPNETNKAGQTPLELWKTTIKGCGGDSLKETVNEIGRLLEANKTSSLKNLFRKS